MSVNPESAAVAEGAVEAANMALYAAVEVGDYDALSDLWIDGPLGATARCVHPGWLALQGRAAILRSWVLIMANTSYIQFFLTEVAVSITGDVAVVTCAENVLTEIGNDALGDAALGGGRVETTNIFRLTQQGWRIWQHHASPVLAPDDTEADDTQVDDASDSPSDDERRAQ